MKNIHLVLIIAILILIYLISMQWLWKDSTTPTPVPPVREVIQIPTPPVVVETPVVEEEAAPEITPVVEEETPIVVEEKKDEKTPIEEKNPDLVEYKSTNYGYHFSMSDQMYYAGFGAKNWALHTVAIQTEALPESLDDSIVRVYYYGKKVLPELQNTQRYVDPNGKYILLLVDNAYSVRIEADNLKSSTVQTIESTIGVD